MADHTLREDIAAVAPAEARSCFALTFLVTRGRLLPPAATIAPVLVRLLPTELVELLKALVLEILRACAGLVAGLIGLDPMTSLVLTAAPFLKLVIGGSGSGRLLPEGVETVFVLLIGESFLKAVRATGMGSFFPEMNSCLTASSGFIRRSGSHRKHRARKSRKGSSSVFMTCERVFEDGRRRRPLDETVRRGFPRESKNSFRRVLFSIKCFSGGPKTSMMQASCSCSFSPGKIGTPVKTSARMQPKLHISIGMP